MQEVKDSNTTIGKTPCLLCATKKGEWRFHNIHSLLSRNVSTFIAYMIGGVGKHL